MRRPLLFLAVSLCFGCIVSFLLFKNIFIGAAAAASFLGINFFTTERHLSIINAGFFIIGIISFFMYFNFVVPKSGYLDLRIITQTSYSSMGSFQGRNIMLIGNIKDFKAGDRVRVYGPYKQDINYGEGILGYVSVNRSEKLKNDLVSSFYSLKRKAYDSFSANIGSENTAYVMSICFGDTSYLSETEKDSLKQLGIIHAVSVSGFHMAVIYSIFEKSLGIYIAIILSVLYTIFTGSQSSTIRALIMIIILKLSKKAWKRYDKLSSLALSAMIILTLKPYSYMNIGFVLSYLSILGIFLFCDKFKKVLILLPVKLNENISLSLSSQIFTLPYVAMTLHNVSTAFLLGNLLLIPIFTVVILLGNLGLLFINFKFMFSIICDALNVVLTAIQGGTELLSEISPAMSYFSYEEGLALIIIFICYMLFKHGYRKAKYFPILVLIVIFFEGFTLFPEVQFLNFGKSDSVIIKYHTKSILFTYEFSVKRIETIKKQFRVTRVVSMKDAPYSIKMNNLYYYVSSPENGMINVCSINGDKQIIFERIKQVPALNQSYDIILVPDFGESSITNYDKEKMICYKLLFGVPVRSY